MSGAMEHPVAGFPRVDSLSHGLDNARRGITRIKWITHPMIPMRAGIEETVEDDILGPGAHKGEIRSYSDFSRARRLDIEWFQTYRLLTGEYDPLGLICDVFHQLYFVASSDTEEGSPLFGIGPSTGEARSLRCQTRT